MRRHGVLAAVVALLVLVIAPAPVGAVEVDWDTAVARGSLGQPLSFSVGFRSAETPVRVELLSRLPTDDTAFVEQAQVTKTGDTYRANVFSDGHTLPNTTLKYRFRVTTASGVALGPEAEFTVKDERFDWRSLAGDVVTVHWYEGDDAFARRALEIGEGAVKKDTDLLGVSEEEPIDFFIYASSDALYAALGPGTRENVGGEAHSEIRTLFGLIEPSEIGSDWVGIVIPHELTHLVFHTAVDNPYHFPAHWLDEGIAVYLSEGFGVGHRAEVRAAIEAGTLMPLEGLVAQFPTERDRFSLAYAESVSAVDYLVRAHGQEKLVALVRSYADGVSDDEAFQAAIGKDTAAFEAAWLDDLGAEKPQAYGPQPGPPGPLPPDWTAASPEPGASPIATPRAPAPGATAGPTSPGSGGEGRIDPLVILLLAGIAIAAAVTLGWVTTRGRPGPPAAT
jgi:hypothetical protein